MPRRRSRKPHSGRKTHRRTYRKRTYRKNTKRHTKKANPKHKLRKRKRTRKYVKQMGSSVPIGSRSKPPCEMLLNVNITKRIGRGGNAEIYGAKAQISKCGESDSVVIKTPISESEDTWSTLYLEYIVFHSIGSHPNIIKCYHPPPNETFTGVYFERLPISLSGSLTGMQKILKEQARRSSDSPAFVELKCKVVSNLLHGMDGIISAISHIHSLGIVHRDISPGNIMLLRYSANDLLYSSGSPLKIIDLGEAALDETAKSKALEIKTQIEAAGTTAISVSVSNALEESLLAEKTAAPSGGGSSGAEVSSETIQAEGAVDAKKAVAVAEATTLSLTNSGEILFIAAGGCTPNYIGPLGYFVNNTGNHSLHMTIMKAEDFSKLYMIHTEIFCRCMFPLTTPHEGSFLLCAVPIRVPKLDQEHSETNLRDQYSSIVKSTHQFTNSAQMMEPIMELRKKPGLIKNNVPHEKCKDMLVKLQRTAEAAEEAAKEAAEEAAEEAAKAAAKAEFVKLRTERIEDWVGKTLQTLDFKADLLIKGIQAVYDNSGTQNEDIPEENLQNIIRCLSLKMEQLNSDPACAAAAKAEATAAKAEATAAKAEEAAAKAEEAAAKAEEPEPEPQSKSRL